MKITDIKIPKDVRALIALSILLSIGRVVLYQSDYFLYLLWNLFLAVLPFAASAILLASTRRNEVSRGVLAVGLILWLFLFPNAPYIVTDLIHIHNYTAPSWYDSVLVFSCAWTGVLLGLYSLSYIETVLRVRYSRKTARIFLALAILLSSFGIYLGRFLRFNSWDIVLHPSSFFAEIWPIFSHPAMHQEAYSFTLVFFVFISMSYAAWDFSRHPLTEYNQ